MSEADTIRKALERLHDLDHALIAKRAKDALTALERRAEQAEAALREVEKHGAPCQAAHIARRYFDV